ncbi:MAG: hypothetical protein AB7O74_06045 [Candidatus Nanopelagicales bacterium]
MANPLEGGLTVTALLAEYQALRDEVTSRIEKQQEVTNYAIATIGGFVALATLLRVDDGGMPLVAFLPLLSILLSALCLMAMDHDMNIAHISRYIDGTLRARLSSVEGKGTSLGWEQQRAIWQQHSGRRGVIASAIASSKYALTIIPNIAALVSFPILAEETDVGWMAWTGYAVALLGLLVVLIAAMYLSAQYLRLPARAEKP